MRKIAFFFINIFIKIVKNIDKTVRYFLIFLIRGLRPLLGPAHCKYPVSCTNYAEDKLKNKYLFPALLLITKRVLLCNPFVNPKLD